MIFGHIIRTNYHFKKYIKKNKIQIFAQLDVVSRNMCYSIYVLFCLILLTLLFIKAFRQRMISCWHFTPIILVVGGETNIGKKLQTMLQMISRAGECSYEYSSLSSCSLFSKVSSRARPSPPKFCTQLKGGKRLFKYQKTVCC